MKNSTAMALLEGMKTSSIMRVKTYGMRMMCRAARVLLSFTLQASSPFLSHPFLLLSMGEVIRALAPSPACVCGRLLVPLIDDEPMEAMKRVRRFCAPGAAPSMNLSAMMKLHMHKEV